MKIYMISDTHFNHKNIIDYCNRPFKDIDEMNNTIINNWNKIVKKDDIVYHLGDLFLGSKFDLKDIVDRLNGTIYLIRGNHDRLTVKSYEDCGIIVLKNAPIIMDDYKIMLSHRPLPDTMINDGYINIHGHIHQNKLEDTYDNTKYSVKCKSIIVHNIPVLLESYYYEAYSLDDRIILIEKDATYDDLSLLVPKEIEELLISYKSRNNSGIKMKRIILEKLYQFLLSDIDKYKSYNSSLFSSIKTVITKMGVSQEIDKKYQNLTNYKLRKYYDNCYQMILYLIKTEEVLKAKEELKNI